MTTPIKVYEVGGSVRDRLMGVESKDQDFAVEAPSWHAMREHVYSISTKVFLEKPEFLTIRALVKGKPQDFVLCRRDGSYSDGRRPDEVTPGTIMDDLARRDFTVNAIAVDTATGEVLDPFSGQADLKIKLLRCVGNTESRFEEDALRIIRAIRFSIIKGFGWSNEIIEVMQDGHQWAPKLASVSKDRIREELARCFMANTPRTICCLAGIHSAYLDVIFDNSDGKGIWLLPTRTAR